MAPNIRLRLPAVAAATALFASVFLIAPPAHADAFDANDEATLVQAVADANASVGHDTITVTADITTTEDLILDITESLTIDVGAHSVESVRVRSTADFTLTGDRAAGGSWEAGKTTGPHQVAAPGIGISAGNTATISDVTLTARGSTCSAAIGGWVSVDIDGCVDSTEIGSGEIVIVDATVNAIALDSATAIGSALFAASGDVTILRSDVTTSPIYNGIGTPWFTSSAPISALSVTSSTLTNVKVQHMLTTLEGANTFVGDTNFHTFATTNNGVVEVDGHLSGRAITNSGTIYPASNVVSTNVAGNAFVVSFDDNHSDAAPAVPLTVYAPTLSDVGEAVPTPSRAGFVITEWNTAADGSGTAFTDTTALSSVAAAGAVTVYAIWQEQVLLLNPAGTALTAGEDETFTVTLNEPFGEIADLTSSSTFSSSNASDQVTGATITFTEVGTRTITAVYGTTTLTASVSARAGAPSSIEATPSATSVNQGDSISLAVAGTDAYGNPTEIDPADVVVTSDVSTDVIDGLKVTFPHASPHVLTVTVGELSTTMTIEVIPIPAPTPEQAAIPAALPATGGELPVGPLVAGTILTLLGAAALILTAQRNMHRRAKS